MNEKLVNEISNYMNMDTLSYMIAKQLIKKGYTTSNLKERLDILNQVYEVRIYNAINDIDKGFKKWENIPNIKLNN